MKTQILNDVELTCVDWHASEPWKFVVEFPTTFHHNPTGGKSEEDWKPKTATKKKKVENWWFRLSFKFWSEWIVWKKKIGYYTRTTCTNSWNGKMCQSFNQILVDKFSDFVTRHWVDFENDKGTIDLLWMKLAILAVRNWSVVISLALTTA